MRKKRRGPARFAGITYAQVAEWTGLTLGTVRNYASRGQFDRKDVDLLLQWVNFRRQAAGLPMVGIPQPNSLVINDVPNTNCPVGEENENNSEIVASPLPATI